jgi:hypothetical protein
MYTNVNLLAPVGALAFLGSSFVAVVAGLVLIHALLTGRFGRAKLFLLAIVIIAGIYFGAILIFSLASGDTALARGQEKHFCEIDCHLAYSVVDVNQSKTLGNPANQITAAGMYNAITIKTRFDETTISAHRGDGLLYPNRRELTVIDAEGRKYFPSTDGQRAFEQSKGAGTPLTTPLRPGESYTTTLVFDLPTNVSNPTLLINEGEWLTHVVIGHENSPLHKKTRFQL